MAKRIPLLALLWSFFTAIPADGAIGFLSETHLDTGSATSITLTVTVNAGDTVCVFVALKSATITVSAVTDNGSGGSSTYTKLAGTISASYDDAEMWGVLSSKAATTITVTPASAVIISVDVLRYSGVAAFGNTATNGSAGSTAPSVTLTTQDANNWMVAGFENGASATSTINQGTARLLSYKLNQGSQQISTADNTAASPGSLTASTTLSASQYWGAAAVELRSTTGGTACNNRIALLGAGCR